MKIYSCFKFGQLRTDERNKRSGLRTHSVSRVNVFSSLAKIFFHSLSFLPFFFLPLFHSFYSFLRFLFSFLLSFFPLEQLRMTLIQSCLRPTGRRSRRGAKRRQEGMMARNGYSAKNIFLKYTCYTYRPYERHEDADGAERREGSPSILHRVRDTPFSRVPTARRRKSSGTTTTRTMANVRVSYLRRVVRSFRVLPCHSATKLCFAVYRDLRRTTD